MTTPPILNGRIIVQAERAASAVLARHLAKTETSFIEWVPLNFVATEGGETTVGALVSQLATGLRTEEPEARKAVDDLVHASLLTDTDPVRLTSEGMELHGRISAGVSEITERLYRDVPEADQIVARRVLETLTLRARAELATRS
jgi:hypothetical protein